MEKYTKQNCEYLRQIAKNKFSYVRGTWCDLLRWAAPHRARWILSQTPGERKNQHIVDPTHILGLRSYVAGFLEGNTSASRPWYRTGVRDSERNDDYEAKEWLQHFTERQLSYLSNSNFYHAAGFFYYDYGTVNTGSYYIEILENGLHFHNLMPGSYFVINDAYGDACIMVREFSLNVKALVDKYGKKKSTGQIDWTNISTTTKKMYEESNYTTMVDLVHVIQQNDNFDPQNPDDPENRQWIELTYELGGGSGHFYSEGREYGIEESNKFENKFLKRFTQRRKPFIVGKSGQDFEYGENGPTQDALGLIKSLNKKAIGKDQALEQILKPTLQGPSNLRKSYVTTSPNSFIPLDSRSVSNKQKLESVFQISPAIAAVIQDTGDLRTLVGKLYYEDFLLYLTKNPKTRTATETDAILEEQQRVIGPNLQSLNTTHNIPVTEYLMDYVLYEDPYLKPIPPSLQGQALTPEFVSVFSIAQKAADLPSIDRYTQMALNIAQVDPRMLDKINLDKLADLYEDRLYLPAGLNNPQAKVDAMREQAQREAQKQQAMQETIPAMAKAAKDVSGLQGPQ